VLAEVLRGAGFCVDTAGSAEEAMAAVARGAPRAALVDLAMPGVSGLELAAALHRRAPDVHVAIVTGLDAARDPSSFPLAASGVERVFSKPIDLRALLTYLDAAAPTASP
jgi:CheY-like chemotaxis protein